MHLAGLCLRLAPALLLAGPATGAVECTVTSMPGLPSAGSSAFGDDISFDATAHVACLLDGDPTSLSVCISARTNAVSGSTGFRRGGRFIDYTLKIDGLRIDDAETEIFSGTVPVDGLDLPIRYNVSSRDYAGAAEGNYSASFTWTIFYDPPTCN